jgi:hypothetical protein
MELKVGDTNSCANNNISSMKFELTMDGSAQ